MITEILNYIILQQSIKNIKFAWLNLDLEYVI